MVKDHREAEASRRVAEFSMLFFDVESTVSHHLSGLHSETASLLDGWMGEQVNQKS